MENFFLQCELGGQDIFARNMVCLKTFRCMGTGDLKWKEGEENTYRGHKMIYFFVNLIFQE